MLTIATLAKQNEASPGKMLFIQVGGRYHGLLEKIDDTRADMVAYSSHPVAAMPRQAQSRVTSGEQDKVAIGEDNERRAAIEKILTDAGATPKVLATIDEILKL